MPMFNFLAYLPLQGPSLITDDMILIDNLRNCCHYRRSVSAYLLSQNPYDLYHLICVPNAMNLFLCEYFVAYMNMNEYTCGEDEIKNKVSDTDDNPSVQI